MSAEDRIKKFYERMAPLHEELMHEFWNIPRTAYAKYFEHWQSVVEFGIGTGLSIPHYPHGVNITGIDISPSMIGIAENKATPQDYMICRSVSENPFMDDEFDGGVADFYFSVTDRPQKDLGEMVRITKPGSALIMHDHFNPDPSLLNRVVGWINYQAVVYNQHRNIEQLAKEFPLDLVRKDHLGMYGKTTKRDTWLYVFRNRK